MVGRLILWFVGDNEGLHQGSGGGERESQI